MRHGYIVSVIYKIAVCTSAPLRLEGGRSEALWTTTRIPRKMCEIEIVDKCNARNVYFDVCFGNYINKQEMLPKHKEGILQIYQQDGI